jgi:ketosteroid isomerase-like protein
MSEENVEKIRAALEAWSRGDWEEALKDIWPECIFDNSTTIGEWRGVHRGHDEIRRLWQRITEPWQQVELRVDEVIEAQDDLVVTTGRSRFIGRDGIELPGPTRSGWVWRFRDGQIVHLAFYNSLDDALEATGLRE